MNIERINGINNVYKPAPAGQTGKTREVETKDSAQLSADALKASQELKFKEIAKNSPDIRMDRVNELKAKINDPAYLNNESVLKALTERIAESMGLK